MHWRRHGEISYHRPSPIPVYTLRTFGGNNDIPDPTWEHVNDGDRGSSFYRSIITFCFKQKNDWPKIQSSNLIEMFIATLWAESHYELKSSEKYVLFPHSGLSK